MSSCDSINNSDKTNNSNIIGNETKPKDQKTNQAVKLEIQKDVGNDHRTTMTMPPSAMHTKATKQRDKSDLGNNFVAPDGGWGWLVAIASGINTLVTFAMMQQFGIIFRQRLLNLGITSSQMTTIVNTQIAVSAGTGLLNGPMFRWFSYRQVAIVGSLLTFAGLFLAVFADSFIFYLMSISVLYGIGRGFTVSASSLAVNTYFDVQRQTATAYQWTVAGLGPIFLPYFATFLLHCYGVQGAVLIFSAISLHTVACSLVYQPVRWHVKKTAKETEALNMKTLDPDHTMKEAEQQSKIRNTADPVTPMMLRGNHSNWCGSQLSLSSQRRIRRRVSSLSEYDGVCLSEFVTSRTPLSFVSIKKISITIEAQEEFLEETPKQVEHEHRGKLPFYKKIVVFFGFDLLQDISYLNLVIGLTVINFAEVNFAILTPFILADFGYQNDQIAMAMSLLGICDLCVRFLIPFVAPRISSDSKVFFLAGVIGMCLGRAVVAHSSNFTVLLIAFGWMGLNKALRIVFWSLIIPSYVPLKRLPAAAGLQLLISGIFTITVGPLIGLIRDATDYTVTIHCLNGICYFASLMWIGEAVYRSYQSKNGK